jgi:Ca2+-binding RTX toxin-like protein
MYNIVEEYMGKHWLYMAEVVDEFDGTFSLLKEEQKTYTNKSQYLRKVALTGNNNNDLTGNKFDNSLFGNSGNNNIKPLGGFDIVDGGPGDDTAIFMGKKSEYILRNQDGRIIVDDINYWRDGQNILINMEKLKFLDKTINVTDTRK